ncbi:MAG TPA: EamA family transporter RarD [Micromonosporaceae bacterium]|nr:EamA family transporter RarD [Micromonosporaceae bacterium]
MGELRRGYLYGLAAYVSWGFFPFYFKSLLPAGPLEILAHRIVWSVVFVALLLTVLRRWQFVTALARQPRALGGILLAAVFIAVNWGLYIYGVNTERIVETSLGYFINPLVSVVFGVALLGERLRGAQWAAVGLGAGAVAVLTVDYRRLPYIALTLAMAFGCYGLVKKRLQLPPADGLLVESAVLALPAVGYLSWLSWRGGAEVGTVSLTHTVLTLLSGVVTAVPLLLFAGAANRIPLTGLGMLQYVAPIIQLCVAVFIYREPMPPLRLGGFALVWLALAVFTWDAFRHGRRLARGRARDAAPTGREAASAGKDTAPTGREAASAGRDTAPTGTPPEPGTRANEPSAPDAGATPRAPVLAVAT